MAVLADPLRPVLGDKAAKKLASVLDLQTVGDLLGYYPRRYDKRGELTDLAGLREGDHVTVQAEVASVSTRRMRNRPGTILEAVVTDGTGRLTLTFFGRGRQDWRERELAPGTRGLFSGQVSSYHGKRQLAHPDYEAAANGPDPGCGGGRVRRRADPGVPGDQPAAVLEDRGLGAPRAGLCWTCPTTRCRPRSGSGCASRLRRGAARHPPARRRGRLTGEPSPAEMGRSVRAAGTAGPAPPGRVQLHAPSRGRRCAAGLLDAFDQALPFQLTAGQQTAGATIAADLAREHPMHRLLQGEVGSGKTIIALRAMLQVVDAAGQAALLAPTEVLAQQHYRSIASMLGPLGMAGQLGGADHATTADAADRLDGQPRPGARRCWKRRRAEPGSSSARTRCSRTRCSSLISAWS